VNPELIAQLEAALFASDAPLPLERLVEVMEAAPEDVRLALEHVRAGCEAPGRGIGLVEVGGGWRLVTRPEVAPVLVRLQRLRLRSRLSRAALETLAIVAYRQPISRPEIEQLRGVSADAVVTHLLERRLVRVVGRKAVPGRPLLYGTTREFLEHFGLRDLGELPPFEEAGGPGGAGETTAGPGDVAPAAPGGAGGEADAGGGDPGATAGVPPAGAPDAPGAEEGPGPGRVAEGPGPGGP
jgi:segregation and condensation protein B